MIEHELLLLGLLAERPRHGYEIKKRIKEILSLFAGIHPTSIYYPLKILEKRGFVVNEAHKQGARPRRFVYQLTPKGKLRFKHLLTKSLLDFKRPQFTLDLSLYFLHEIDPAVARRRLRARIVILEKVAGHLRHMHESLEESQGGPLSGILEHNLQMVETESQFLTRWIQDL